MHLIVVIRAALGPAVLLQFRQQVVEFFGGFRALMKGLSAPTKKGGKRR